ncbi:MAG: hypothetical protein ACT443_01640 [Gemmatimonadota bacterium]
MRARIGTVVPLLAVLGAPAFASAQQRVSIVFDAAPSALTVAQEPQEPEEKPNEAMSTSGFFLGIIGMLGGAVIGSQVGQSECPPRAADKECMGRHAYTGALIAGTAMVPLGVHIANQDRRNLPLSLAVSAGTGALLYYTMKAIPGEPIAMAPFLAAPLQVVTSVKVENRK